MTAFDAKTARAQLANRRARHKNQKRIDNGALPAGSPMYYYCRGCGAPFEPWPEAHLDPAPRYCVPCWALAQHGLLE